MSDQWYTVYEAHRARCAVTPIDTSPATDFVQAGGTGPQVPQCACGALSKCRQ